jgi:hypothetical protein
MSGAIARDAPFPGLFNQDSFVFAHGLHLEPLYDLPTLIDLAGRVGPEGAYWSTRPAAIGDGWEEGPPPDMPLQQAVATIGQANSLVVLKNIETDPVFSAVFRDVVADMAQRAGPALLGDMVHGRATLLISSPRRITGYHIDAEANFLLQLRGAKTVHVFDGRDPAIVPEEEREAFYAGNMNAAQYRPAQQSQARVIDFRPGTGVHVPVDWPHWVQNGDGISVSISINYDLRSNAARARTLRDRHRARLGPQAG